MISIYTDGSYIPNLGTAAYGFVVLDEDGEMIYKDSGQCKHKDFLKQRNVYGEVIASLKAIQYCIYNNINEVEIIYDYRGVEYWATGKWKRNNELTKKYHELINNISKYIKIKFTWVKGHSGVQYNELVDDLARGAAKE